VLALVKGDELGAVSSIVHRKEEFKRRNHKEYEDLRKKTDVRESLRMRQKKSRFRRSTWR
jgi:hypothetical protein